MKSILKRYVLKKVLPAFFILITVAIGLIKIDVINTKALSPLGNTNENYKIVSEEFGEDFSNFIKDNSFLKIYKEDGNNILIRLGDDDFKITNKSIFINKIEDVLKNLVQDISGVKGTIEKVLWKD